MGFFMRCLTNPRAIPQQTIDKSPVSHDHILSCVANTYQPNSRRGHSPRKPCLMPVFEVYDDQAPRRIRTEKSIVILGRTADIFIDDRGTSRKHCRICLQDQDYVLTDLGSRNGTHLNLAPVDNPVILQDGDKIGIGTATIRFWIDDRHANPTLPETSIDQPKEPVAQEAVSQNHASIPEEPRPTTNHPPHKRKHHPPKPKQTAPSIPSATPKLTVDTPITPTVITQPVEPGSLATDDIIPLNHEGKPANAIDPDTGRVSEAMFRLKELLLRSFQFHSTDIHIEPKENHYQLRYRIDGTLHTLGKLELRLVRPIYSIVKLLCNLDINLKNALMDGSFDVQLPDRRVQLRVSIAPSITGDKMVLRILDTVLTPKGLDSLNMDHYVLEQVRHKTAQNSSMIVVCGPTGSGKTTTAYAILREMDAHSRNIVTVEQPVEYKLENVSQIEIPPESRKGHELTFSTALRSLLRQDPDVILVGEIRDQDTARMAVQAAMTGHLMLSTVHARDSIGCIFRLIDLGVEPFLLASALTAVLSQRLMRKLCDKCKSKMKASIAQLSAVGLDELAGQDLYTAIGCDQCFGIGYNSRVPIFELLSVNDQVRDAIAHRPTIQQLRIAAGDWIFQTLREDGIRKLRDGLTSLDEFSRVAHQDS